jgi:hypothetical protein
MGSSGGWPNDNLNTCLSTQSCGGGLLQVVVYNSTSDSLQSATINGTIDMGGNGGGLVGSDTSGGGAGGTILVEASMMTGNGTLTATGGTSLGSGGGGIIFLISDTTAFSGTISVSTSGSAQPGIISKTTPPVNGY